jgi:hypothetical protein
LCPAKDTDVGYLLELVFIRVWVPWRVVGKEKKILEKAELRQPWALRNQIFRTSAMAGPSGSRLCSQRDDFQLSKP